MKLTATQRFHSTPISRKLASNFIELGYGLQVEGMAAEMFFNRSFEPFYPYRLINKLWYDLLEDETNLASRCETDWRVFDWYHSGYEHNAWFAFPGVAGHQLIEDDSTFVIEQSPTADVRIGYCNDACHGDHAMKVENNSDVAFNYWIEIVYKDADGNTLDKNDEFAKQVTVSVKRGTTTLTDEVFDELNVGSEATPIATVQKTGKDDFTVNVTFEDLDDNNDVMGAEIKFDIIVHAVQVEAPNA